MYNPMQSKYENLMQQKQIIEQQMQMIQQYQNPMPPININNQITPQGGNYDFNGKWVNTEQEARNISNSNLPTIMFAKEEQIFYMKDLNGTFRKYSYQEVVEQAETSADERINSLEMKINSLLNALGVKENEQVDIQLDGQHEQQSINANHKSNAK